MVGALGIAASASSDQSNAPHRSRAPDIVWRVEGEGHGRPVVDATTVYFLAAHHDVVALDAATGALRWRQRTLESGDTTEGSTLVLSGGVVVAGDYNLVALDRRTGTIRWRFSPPVGFAPGIYLGEASAGLVFAGSPAGRVYAVDAVFGELAWTTAVATDGRTTVFQPVSDGAVVVTGYTTFTAPNVGGVVLLDALTGRERWRTLFPRALDPRLGTGAAGGPILTDTHVVASSGDGTVYGFDRVSGAIRWTLPPIAGSAQLPPGPFPHPNAPAGADFRPLARTGRTLFVGSLKGPVVAYDLVTRMRRWIYAEESNGSVAFALTSDDLSVYVPYASGRHVALDLSTGAERWRTEEVPNDFNWPSASGGAHVYLAGGRGGFLAIRR